MSARASEAGSVDWKSLRLAAALLAWSCVAPAQEPPAPAQPSVPTPASAPDDRIMQQRPMGKPLEPVIPMIDPKQVPPPSPLLPHETVPIPDRWRLTDQLQPRQPALVRPVQPEHDQGRPAGLRRGLVLQLHRHLRHRCSRRGSCRRPSARSRASGRRPTTSSARASSRRSSQNVIISFVAASRATRRSSRRSANSASCRCINYNYTHGARKCARSTSTRTKGTTRRDSFLGDPGSCSSTTSTTSSSDRYDFDDVRVGIQPFISDFRGFLFQDQPLGIRFFGTRDNNQWQYNVGCVPAHREGHQQRPERPRQAAAQRRRVRRQPVPAGLHGSRLHAAGHGRLQHQPRDGERVLRQQRLPGPAGGARRHARPHSYKVGLPRRQRRRPLRPLEHDGLAVLGARPRRRTTMFTSESADHQRVLRRRRGLARLRLDPRARHRRCSRAATRIRTTTRKTASTRSSRTRSSPAPTPASGSARRSR